MPRRSHRFAPADIHRAVGYFCLAPGDQPHAEAELRAWASPREIKVVAVLADDCPPDTRLNERQGFGHALQVLWEETAGLLVVDSLRSLATDPLHQALAATILSTHGARLVSVAPGEQGSLGALEPMVEAFEVFHDTDHRVRILAGFHAAQRQRRKVGRFAPYGWATAEDGKTLVPNPMEQEVIRLAHQLRAEGLVLREIGQRLSELGHHPRKGGAWRPQGIAYLLQKQPEEP